MADRVPVRRVRPEVLAARDPAVRAREVSAVRVLVEPPGDPAVVRADLAEDLADPAEDRDPVEVVARRAPVVVAVDVVRTISSRR